MKDFYKELPEGYKQDKVVDAKSVGFAVAMNVAALVLTVLAYIAIDFAISGKITFADMIKFAFDSDGESDSWVRGYLINVLLPIATFIVSTLVYFVLHELVHGMAYKILTREKLTFGITWSAAYCGVPGLYVGKKTALIALLSPFVVFSAVFITAAAISGGGIYCFMLKMLFAIHFGGCVGDLYDTMLLLTRYRKKEVLLSDDGPKQVFYIKEVE